MGGSPPPMRILLIIGTRKVTITLMERYCASGDIISCSRSINSCCPGSFNESLIEEEHRSLMASLRTMSANSEDSMDMG